jgi:Protein of unknown function (DUF2835)
VNKIVVNLAISAQEYQLLYAGEVKDVLAQDVEGKRVRFPASILRPYVQHQGIHGQFAIEFDVNNRFKKITRLV